MRRWLLRWVERMLMVVGVIALGYCGWLSAESFLYQSFENRELEKILASAPVPAAHDVASPSRVLVPGSTIGRIEIPRLAVTAIVRAGSDSNVLGDMMTGDATKRYSIELYAQAFNLLNHTNAINFSGVLTSPFFGQATSAAPPRRVEIGARLNF